MAKKFDSKSLKPASLVNNLDPFQDNVIFL